MTHTTDVPAERGRDELLRELSHYWILDGDVMRCVGCNHSLHISRANELLRHRYDCAFADSPAPWTTLAALLAPQEAPPNLPRGWGVEHSRTNVVCPDCAFSFDAIHQDGDGGYTCPLCEPAPASGEPSGAGAVVREALEAIKKAHTAVDDLCNGRRWTMSIPARPDADHDLVIDDALTKAERVIRSLAGPTAPGAPEEGAGE